MQITIDAVVVKPALVAVKVGKFVMKWPNKAAARAFLDDKARELGKDDLIPYVLKELDDTGAFDAGTNLAFDKTYTVELTVTEAP